MWRRLKNILLSIRTYPDLSPDLGMRRRINRALNHREALSSEEWYEVFWYPRHISPEIADFIYYRMTEHSGIQFSRVVPGDRLSEDLYLSQVCWFDWQLSLADEFYDRFQVDLDLNLDLASLSTVEDLAIFLDRQLLSCPTG